MHRRQLIRSFAGALLTAPIAACARTAAQPVGTPEATPRHFGRPRPVVLGDGIELIDYRIYPSPDVPRIIGEIVSTRDKMVDAPVISIVFPDLGDAGYAYAPPYLPVMHPGESNLIFGVLPSDIDSDDKLAIADFGLCGAVASGANATAYRQLKLGLNYQLEIHSEYAELFSGELTNDGRQAAWPKISGLVRDSNERLVGTIPDSPLGSMEPGTAMEFQFWSAVDIPIPANPYLMLAGSPDYTTELVLGPVVAFTAPGCPSILPWNRSLDESEGR